MFVNKQSKLRKYSKEDKEKYKAELLEELATTLFRMWLEDLKKNKQLTNFQVK